MTEIKPLYNPEPCIWVGDYDDGSSLPSGQASFANHGGDAFFEPRLRIGFQTTAKPVYRIAARSRVIP